MKLLNTITGRFKNWKAADGQARVRVTSPISSSYTGLETIGTTAVSYAFALGSIGIKVKVTHATQSISVGMGASAAEAEANAASSMPYAINDLIQLEGRGASITHYALLGSGAATTAHVAQVA